MPLDLPAVLWSVSAAFLVGLSKTGVPGVGLPAVLMVAQAFVGNEKQSVAAILPLLLIGDVMAVGFYRRHAQWHRLWGLFPAVLAGMVPAVIVLHYADNDRFKLILGWMILGLLGVEGVRQRLRENGQRAAAEPNDDDPRAALGYTTLMGLLAGFGTALGNAAGPVMAIYLVGRGMNKEQFIGTWAWFFLIVNALKVPVYTQIGLLTGQTLRYSATFAAVVFLGGLVGRRVFAVIPQKLFNALMLAFAALAAVRLVVS